MDLHVVKHFDRVKKYQTRVQPDLFLVAVGGLLLSGMSSVVLGTLSEFSEAHEERYLFKSALIVFLTC